MTPQEVAALVSRHLGAWFDSPIPPPRTLREHVADAIAEACAITDKEWQDGNETLRRERDEAQRKLAEMTQCRDDAVAACHLIQEGK